MMKYRILTLLAVASTCSGLGADFKFDFEPGVPTAGYVQVKPDATYSPGQGYGYLPKGASDITKMFAVDVPEGNYDVTIRFGNPATATATTIKAESRRLMLQNIQTAPGQFQTRTFTVNVRKPPISTGGVTSLNKREMGPPITPDWDDYLSLEFNGSNPGVAAMEIKSNPSALTVFIAGDSTVTDQPNEPWAGWGMMLPRFFQPGVAVSNQAESGLALYSFRGQKRLDKILSMMKPGDYFFIQFGHNDQKDKSPGAGPFTTYKNNLKQYVAAARSKGGIPVLITPMERRRWLGNVPQPTLADYAEAVRQVGTEDQVPVIDLNAMSLKFYSALGPDNSTKAFVHYPVNTFPGQDKELKDDTHHNGYGAYELARCIVEGIKANIPALAAHLTPDAGTFAPSKPDAPEQVAIPATPAAASAEKPAGS
jgi:lysophospholipase L1-like esterase